MLAPARAGARQEEGRSETLPSLLTMLPTTRQGPEVEVRCAFFKKSGCVAMTDTPRTPERPPRPKRGAFPTPQSQIDDAPRYVPDVDESAENVEEEGTSADVKGETER